MKSLPYVPTGVANIASLAAAFERLGWSLLPVRDAAAIDDAELLLLPGVGNFAAAARELADGELVPALRRRITSGRATLGICLGMQLAAEASEEATDAAGIGAIPGTCRRFPIGVRAPQMGWNLVTVPDDDGLLASGHAYFANSFALRTAPPGYRCAWAEHGGVRFVAAAERGAVLLCQFHPELSAGYGRTLLQRWLSQATSTPPEVVPC